MDDASTLFETYFSLLTAGKQFATITSFGGHAQTNLANDDAANYFDTGTYVLTSSGFDVPKPK